MRQLVKKLAPSTTRFLHVHDGGRRAQTAHGMTGPRKLAHLAALPRGAHLNSTVGSHRAICGNMITRISAMTWRTMNCIIPP